MKHSLRSLFLATSFLLICSLPGFATDTKAIQLNNDAVRALAAQNFVLAIEKLTEATRLDPTYKLASDNLAIAYNNYALKISDPAQRLKYFRAALVSQPTNETTQQNLDATVSQLGRNAHSFAERVAMAQQCERENDTTGAMAEYISASKINLNDPFPLMAMGKLHERLGNLSAATKMYNYANSLSPTARIPTANVAMPNSAPPPAASTGKVNSRIHDKWALIIGIDKFKDPTIPTLKYAAKDATDFYKYLITEANFQPDHVRLILNEKATKSRILTELGDTFLPRVVKPDDLVVVYFSSHGSPSERDVRKKNFLIAYDTKKTNLYADGIEMQALSDQIADRVGADRVLVILDACHSGGADGSKGLSDQGLSLEHVELGKGQMIISSSSRQQRSWESRRYANGVFTKQLIQALRSKGPTTTVLEAFNHTKQLVADEVQQDDAAQQTPEMKSDTWRGNELLLAVPAADSKPLPDTVAKLLEPDDKSTPAKR